MDEEGIMYLAFTLIILLLIITLIPYIGSGIIGLVVVGIVIFGVFLIIMMNFIDFYFVSLVCSLLNITFTPAKGYKIVKGQNAVVKDVGGLFYATGYVTANLFPYVFKLEVAESREEERMIISPDIWERAVMNIDFPFKFHVLAMSLDVQYVRDEFEGQRSYQEYQLSQTLQNPQATDVTVTNIQRKINVIQRKMDRISMGEKPIATVMYIETTAIGVNERSALDALAQQIDAMQIAFSSMDVQLVRVMGRELYTLFNFNFSLPVNIEEAGTYFDKQQ